MALQDDINYLKETKSLIKQAIISKGQEISETDTFRSYVSKINNITSSDVTIVTGSDLLNNIFNSTEPYEFIIPNDVSSLPAKRFNSNETLRHSVFSFTPVNAIYVPETCTSLRAYCFATCPILEKVWIPSTTSIDYHLFGEIANENTVHVYTDATEATWDSDMIDSWQSNLATGYVEVHFNMTYEDYVNKTIPEVSTTATIYFDYTTETNYGTKQNNESYRPLKLNVYSDGTLITSGYLPLSVEVEIGSTVTIDHPTVFPEAAEIYTSDDINSDVYASFDLEEFKYNFSYIATDSASFYIDSIGHVK